MDSCSDIHHEVSCTDVRGAAVALAVQVGEQVLARAEEDLPSSCSKKLQNEEGREKQRKWMRQTRIHK